MPWYKTGTANVTLNSNAVTGTGTAFIVNCRVGDAFRGPDGRWYEVTNVASNTAISIDPPYIGATASGGGYALAPMQGYVKDSADALRAIVTTYGAQLAALKTTGNYDLLPVSKGGTGITDMSPFMQGMLNDADAAAGRGTLGAAKSGVNADITSLTGLATALSVAQGGTGGKTQAAARTGLGLKSAAVADIVGTVSQVGGVPAGAIIERGTSSNGEFTKYADGTLDAWNLIGPIAHTANVDTVFEWTLPVATIPVVTNIQLTVRGAVSTNHFAMRKLQAVVGSETAVTLRGNFDATQGYTFFVQLKGRWF